MQSRASCLYPNTKLKFNYYNFEISKVYNVEVEGDKRKQECILPPGEEITEENIFYPDAANPPYDCSDNSEPDLSFMPTLPPSTNPPTNSPQNKPTNSFSEDVYDDDNDDYFYYTTYLQWIVGFFILVQLVVFFAKLYSQPLAPNVAHLVRK